mmetsp:Transcript_22783/g.42633  ORF Transcript_22783/g.42633 Transcript_22783/m.42633 type:complete len:426 (-) Transcript_22783:37-1314(-)
MASVNSHEEKTSDVFEEKEEFESSRSPEEIYHELGPTALFLRTTTARKAAVLAASRAAKEQEEENARRAAEEKRKNVQKMLQEASLAGMFSLKPILPILQSGRSEWSCFLRRGSVLGLCLSDLLDDPEIHLAPYKQEEYDDAFNQRLQKLNKHMLRSPKQALSFAKLQAQEQHFDQDYRPLFSTLTDKQLRKAVHAFKASTPQFNLSEFRSDRALLFRESIKHSDRVAAITTLFWLAADRNATNTICKREYMHLNRKFQIVILGMYDQGLGMEMALRDWEFDCDENGLLPFNGLLNSLFLLADMFAGKLDEETYLAFLTTIAQRVMRFEGSEGNGRLVFREDTKIIPRKAFEYIRSEFPKWTAFEIPSTSAECRKLYGTSSAQIENLVDDIVVAKSRARHSLAETAQPLSRAITKGLHHRRSKKK